MTTLTTIFGIALIGVLFMLLIKLLEQKLGRSIFLPEQILNKDEKIKTDLIEKTEHVQQTCMNWGGTVGAVCMHWAKKSALHTKKWLSHRPRQALVKSENASDFLKEVNQHKQDFRRENGYHEE